MRTQEEHHFDQVYNNSKRSNTTLSRYLLILENVTSTEKPLSLASPLNSTFTTLKSYKIPLYINNMLINQIKKEINKRNLNFSSQKSYALAVDKSPSKSCLFAVEIKIFIK